MAHAVFIQLVKQAGFEDQIKADSAGTGDWHLGEQPHHGTRNLLHERGITYVHAARQVTTGDLEQFDYLVAMDESNMANVRRLGRAAHAKVRLLTDYIPNPRVRDVPDPYYTGNFEEVYELVEAGGRGLLAEIQHDLNA